jgi:nucleoside-diphosphate-sugar epimerase
MKVLVTGASGRIGKFVVDRLESDHEVAIFDKEKPVDQMARFIEGDVQLRDSVLAALQGFEAVVHLAAVPMYTGENEVFMDVNIGGTFNVLEGAIRNDVKKLVFASSICSYGFIFWKKKFTPDYFPIDELHPTRPDDMYGVSKLVGDQLCYAYSERYDISTICLRLATVWFPNSSYTQRFIDRLAHPEQGVNGIWNYVDVRDLAESIILALAKDVKFDIYNIGARDVASYTESLDLIRQFYSEVPMIRNHHAFLTERDRALFDITKARRELGYKPVHTWREYT